MKQFLIHAKNILTGVEQITNKLKFTAMIYSIAMVHLFLTFLFFFLHIPPLFIFNIISVLTYLISMHWVRSENFLTVYFITYTEIILHSVAAVLCVGYQSGFLLYIIGVVPVGFYICYTLKSSHRTTVIAMISALAAAMGFFGCRIISYFVEPFYPIENPRTELFLYIFNSACTFLFVIVFSLLFVFEMKLTSARLRHQNAILEQLANTDPLTGLYNRRSMNLFLTQALESDSDFSVIMCDIDDFKKINDTYGHDMGDEVLQEIAHIAVEQVRESGYVCRWGGEEILILISNGSREATWQIAENIRRKVSNQMFSTDQKSFHCTLTLGIAPYEKGKTVEETITQADYNLYCGKRNGKNKVVENTQTLPRNAKTQTRRSAL